jgi:hypothetical protein
MWMMAKAINEIFANLIFYWTYIYFHAASEMFSSRGIPPQISVELEDRTIKAGFVNQVVNIIPLAINHGGKSGDLFW